MSIKSLMWGDFLDISEKEELIESFLEAIKEDGRVLKYINEENIRNILEEQIGEFDCTDFIEVPSWAAAYDGEEKVLTCRPQYKDNLKILMHEIFHALTNNMHSSLIFGDQATIGKSGLFFMYLGTSKNWHDQYEVGRGLNEGVTQYLTRHIAGTLEHTSLLKPLGLNIVDDVAYPIEQQIVEELVAMYGEDAVLGSYFETSPKRLLQAIRESGAIKKPQAVLAGLMSKLDVNEVLDRIGLMTDAQTYKKDFRKIQQFVTKELIEKEVNFALKSKDIGSLARVQQMLKNLQGLDVSIDGRNVFENVIKHFNDKIQRMQNGKNFMVEPSTRAKDKTGTDLSRAERLQLSILTPQRSSVSLIKLASKEMTAGLFRVAKRFQRAMLKAHDKNVLGFISAPRDDIEVNQSPPEEGRENTEEQKKEALLTAIRGCPKENYEKACQESEQAWANQECEDKGTRNSQIDR